MSYSAALITVVATLLVTPAIAASDTPSKGSTTPAAPATSAGSAPGSTTAPEAVPPKPLPNIPPGYKGTTKPSQTEKKIDLNSASAAELKKIPGVGDAEAQKIIANRPYTSKTELVTKAGLPEGVYVSAKHKVEARPVKGGATSKKASATSTKAATAEPQKSEPKKSETKQ